MNTFGKLAFRIIREGTVIVATLAAFKAAELAIKNKGFKGLDLEDILELKKKG